MKNLIFIFLGGGLGSMARYGTTHFVNRFTSTVTFPWHTLTVNLIGAFLIGILMEYFALRSALAEPARYLLIVGFLGGFTTFSAFSLETSLLIQKGDFLTCATYIAASVLGTIAGVFVGSALIKSIIA